MDDEHLNSISRVIEFMNVSRVAFYKHKTQEVLKDAGILFSRPGKYGKTVWWSYKRLVLGWMVKNPKFFMIGSQSEKTTHVEQSMRKTLLDKQ